MAYEPKTWVCGETITADGLNNLEEGVQEALECCGGGGGTEPLVVEITYDSSSDSFIASKSYYEVATAVQNGQDVVFNAGSYPSSIVKMNGSDVVSWGFGLNGNQYDYGGYMLDALDRVTPLGNA